MSATTVARALKSVTLEAADYWRVRALTLELERARLEQRLADLTTRVEITRATQASEAFARELGSKYQISFERRFEDCDDATCTLFWREDDLHAEGR